MTREPLDRAGFVFPQYQDENGKPIKKTPLTHPYSYDGYVTYRNGTNQEIEDTVYSDRLTQWDYHKTKNLMQQHFGNQGDYYSSRSPKKIEAFLSECIGREIKLILIMQYCNAANGYPVWRFDYCYK